jgi:hypothetical protein
VIEDLSRGITNPLCNELDSEVHPTPKSISFAGMFLMEVDISIWAIKRMVANIRIDIIFSRSRGMEIGESL